MPTNKQTPPAATELFTPGEWTAQRLKNDNLFPAVRMGKHKRKKGVYNTNPIITITDSHDYKIETMRANAALIAAAPDLYYSLKEMILTHGEDNNSTRTQRTEAERKATAALQKSNPNYKP